MASWRRSISPYSGGTVPESHRLPFARLGSPNVTANGSKGSARASDRVVSGRTRRTETRSVNNAEGAPDFPSKRGGPEEGACPLLHHYS